MSEEVVVPQGQDESGSPEKKETFQWSTPADEFADDVGSDIDEESEDEGEGRAMEDGSTVHMEASHYSEVTNGQLDVKFKLDSDQKKNRAKNQFPCPKCNKVWNWPWELRRHLVMHFKEVSVFRRCSCRLSCTSTSYFN
jgi:hypothetical protein